MMRMTVAAVLLCAGAGLAQPRADRAGVDERVAAAMQAALGGVETAAEAADVAALGPNADVLLVARADDDARPLQRLRALAALRWAPSSYAHDFLMANVARLAQARTGLPVLELAMTLQALLPYGAAAAPTLLGALSHPTTEVRLAAAATLAQIDASGTDGAIHAALTARLAVETSAAVRRALITGLQKITQ
jgi:hypothetical protein